MEKAIIYGIGDERETLAFPLPPFGGGQGERPPLPADVQRHDQMVALVERMLSLHQQLASAKTPNEKTLLQRQIDATDKQIDALVYELYRLTEGEIKLV